MPPKQLICSICTMHVQSRCISCIFLNVKKFFIGNKRHTYQNIATKIPHTGVCYLIKESLIEIHIHCTWPRWGFQKVYTFPCLFIVQNHTYNTQMSLQVRNITVECRQLRRLAICKKFVQ